jgi:hypothetical protein
MAKNLFQKVLLSSSYFGQPEQAGVQGSDICKVLQCEIPSSVAYPFTTKYNASLSSYYTAQEEELQPSCIFTPKHAADVSRFIKIVTSDVHRNAETCGSPSPQFAIRSGGHAVFSGAANIEGGVTVDLRELNSVTISEDRSIAAIGSGAVWSEVYPLLVPHNLTVMGGRVAGVGVGGFLTGGAYQTTALLRWNSKRVSLTRDFRWYISPLSEARLGLRQRRRLRNSARQRRDRLR